MNIALTDFWIKPRGLIFLVHSTILHDNLLSVNNSRIIGKGKLYYYNSQVQQYQVYCVVVDNIFYVDYSCPDHLLPFINQQMWILKHIKGVEYTLKRICIWEQFNLPTIEQLNEFAKNRIVNKVVAIEDNYEHSITQMSLSTGLSEELLLRNIHFSLSEYILLMCKMFHSHLSNEEVVHHATVIHNHKYAAQE